jgi:hypothetical protein
MDMSGQLHSTGVLLSTVFIHKIMGPYQKSLLRGIYECRRKGIEEIYKCKMS